MTLDDSTATATVIKHQSFPLNVKTGAYVEIFCHITQQEEIIVRNTPKLITDFNQVIFHNLMTIQAWYHRNKKSTKKKDVLQNDLLSPPEQTDVFSKLQHSIMKMLNRPKAANGTTFNDLLNVLGEDHTPDEIGEAISGLYEYGVLYQVQEGVYKPILK
jgi:hypothetical protein